MQTRRDHVQAYRDATDRMSAALLAGEAFSGKPPLRRSTTGALFGTLLAGLICVIAFVYGLIFPGGNTAWRQPGTVVVEEETGNRYVLADGVLHPTANLTSALLLVGNAAPPFAVVTRASLDGTPVGPPVGILGAPDTLPVADGWLPAAWTRCATGAMEYPMFGPAPTPVGEARVLVIAPAGQFVVWRDRVHPVEGDGALSALGLADATALAVSDDWIAALPAGPVLAAPDVPDAGEDGPVVDGVATQLGQVLTVATPNATPTDPGGGQAHLLRADGLAPVNPTAAALLAARPDAPPAVAVGPDDVGRIGLSPDRAGLDVPDLLSAPTVRVDPAQPGGAGAVCAGQSATADGTLTPGPVTVVLGAPPPGPAVLTPGTGMLVVDRPVPPTGRQEGGQWLLTDQGIRYPLDVDSARLLGGGGAPQYLPPQILTMLPVGPALVRPPAAAVPALAVPAGPGGSVVGAATGTDGGAGTDGGQDTDGTNGGDGTDGGPDRDDTEESTG